MPPYGHNAGICHVQNGREWKRGDVAQYSGMRRPPQPLVVALILVVCTATGLVAGVRTRQIINGLAQSSTFIPGGQGGSGTGTASTNGIVPTSSPKGNVLPTATPASGTGFTGFTLLVRVSPTVVAPGEQFTVIVTVIAKDRVTPLGGVLCTLGGSTSLFAKWPAAVLSTVKGRAMWTLQAPNVPVGTYKLEVSANGTRGYFYYTVAFLQISS